MARPARAQLHEFTLGCGPRCPNRNFTRLLRHTRLELSVLDRNCSITPLPTTVSRPRTHATARPSQPHSCSTSDTRHSLHRAPRVCALSVGEVSKPRLRRSDQNAAWPSRPLVNAPRAQPVVSSRQATNRHSGPPSTNQRVPARRLRNPTSQPHHLVSVWVRHTLPLDRGSGRDGGGL